MKLKAGIVGASGYAGIELVRLLAKHPGVELACVTSRSLAGTKVADNMPALRHLLADDMKFTESSPEAQAKMDVDVWFLALPHGAAAEYAKPLIDAGNLQVLLQGRPPRARASEARQIRNRGTLSRVEGRQADRMRGLLPD